MQLAAAEDRKSLVGASLLAEISFRSIGPADASALRTFIGRLSRETGYKRLLSGRSPTDEEIHRWAAIDRSREAALVATECSDGAELIVGVARYVKESAFTAEFAIVLADAWQHRGLGKALVSRLIQSARTDGILRLTGVTLSSNVGMLALARGHGFKARRLPDGFTTDLRLDL